VIAADTNIIVRLIVRDHAAQAAAAEKLVEEPVFLSSTVLLESAWVLGSSYRLDRATIAEALLALLDLPTIAVEDEALVRWAIGRYASDHADIADMLHLVEARGSDGFATFDRAIRQRAGEHSPIPVIVLNT
jgi:predicted nucleic-acid-binding protein